MKRPAVRLPHASCLALLAALPLGDPSSPADAVDIDGDRYLRAEGRGNEFTSSSQDHVALAMDPSGAALLVWDSRRQEGGGYGVYARRFDPTGTPVGGELHVNTTVQGLQIEPACALAGDGDAWFAWVSLEQDGDRGGIVVRRIGRSAERDTGELLADVDGSGHQAEVAVAARPDGGAVVVWTRDDDTRAEKPVLARLYGADGAPVGAPFRVDATRGVRANLPTVGVDASGAFAVAWARTALDGVPTGIHARRFDAAGAALGGDLAVHASVGLHVEPALSMNAAGDFAVAWLTAQGEDYEARLRRFTAGAEEPWGAVQRLALGTPPYTSGLDLSLRDDGSLLVAWNSFSDARRQPDLYARCWDADGAPLGETFRVTARTEGAQQIQAARGTRRVLWADDGRMAFGWSGDAGLGDDSAANLTLLLPESLGIEPGGTARGEAQEDGGGALALAPAPHDPPIYDPRHALPPGPPPQHEAAAGTGFTGIAQTPWIPPDPEMAVGPGHVVLMTNGAIAWYTKDGTFQFQQAIEGAGGFWGAQGAQGFVFDPEVIYDPHTDRFFAMANERSGPPFFLLAVSDDSDPNGTWFRYRINVQAAAGDTDIDSPNIGIDAQAVYLTADFFGPDKFLVYILDKAPLLTGGAPVATSLLITGEQSIGVPVTYGTPPAQYMVGAFEFGVFNTIRLHAITDPLGTPTRVTFDLTVPSYSHPEDPPQMGTTSRPEMFEARFWDCVYRNGSLWATHHQGVSRVTQRWYQIDMGNWPVSGTPTLVQSGDIDPGSPVRTFFGSINVDDQNNMGVVVARSSATEFISMACATRTATDPPGTTRPLTTVQTSTTPETSGRWGDYSDTDSDPASPGTFWGMHEYRGAVWFTWVAAFQACRVPETYCTGKTNSLGCVPFLSSTGEPSTTSTTAFAVVANDVLPTESGILLYGVNGRGNLNFHGGKLCVKAPLSRLLPPKAPNAGGAPPCTGVLSRDFNARIQSGVDPNLTAGQVVNAQWRQRDPSDPAGFGDSLTDGIEFTVCP